MRSRLNKFEHVHRGPCAEQRVELGRGSMSMYSEVECIMGNGQMGLSLCTDRHTHTTENMNGSPA